MQNQIASFILWIYLIMQTRIHTMQNDENFFEMNKKFIFIHKQCQLLRVTVEWYQSAKWSEEIKLQKFILTN